MYEETDGCSESDPNSMSLQPKAAVLHLSENGFSQTMANVPVLPSFPPPLIAGTGESTHRNFEDNLSFPIEDYSYPQHHRVGAGQAMEFEFQQQAGAAEVGFDNSNTNPNCEFQEVTSDSNRMMACYDQSNWVVGTQIQQMGFNQHRHDQIQSQAQFSDSAIAAAAAYSTQAPDLLNFFNMPRCSNSSVVGGFLADLPGGGGNNPSPSTSSLSIMYDPLFQLNLPPPQPPLFRELFQSVTNGYGVSAVISGGGVYEEGDGSGVFEFGRDMEADCIIKKGKMSKQFSKTERQRRVQVNDKYKALRSLVPNPTKNDRASIVGDATEYIQELQRTVKELKQLVEKKRCSRERRKRQRMTGEEESVQDSCSKAAGAEEEDECCKLRSSWLQRKTKDTEVDVRIIDDEVTIKLVQRKVNCLLTVSKLLDHLRLDLHHVAGGHIGDYYSFLFNTKIYEGSSVYASAIANKVIEAVDRQYNNNNSY